jgi:hypothetical protein
VCVCVFACVYVSLSVITLTVTPYTYNNLVEEVRVRKKERNTHSST